MNIKKKKTQRKHKKTLWQVAPVTEMQRRTKQGITFKCLAEKFVIFWIKHHLHYCQMKRNTAANAIKEQIITRHQREQRCQISRQTQNLLKTKLHQMNKWILHFLCSTSGTQALPWSDSNMQSLEAVQDTAPGMVQDTKIVTKWDLLDMFFFLMSFSSFANVYHGLS